MIGDRSHRERPGNAAQAKLKDNVLLGTIKAEQLILQIGNGEELNIGQMIKEIHAALKAKEPDADPGAK